jgi:hypothetical protein
MAVKNPGATYGYDPTGTGRYGVGTFYDGVSGVNIPMPNTGNTTVRSPLIPKAKPYVPEQQKSETIAQPSLAPVKIATPDIVKAVHEKAYSNEKMLEPFFEDFGLQEILSVARNSSMNIVNGQNVLYQPIVNIASLYLQYNPLNILPLQSADTIFKNFSIVLEDKTIDEGSGTGPNGEAEYLDEFNNLIINVTNLQADELVEIESLSIESKLMIEYDTGGTS